MPRKSINLSGLDWSRRIVEQFIVTEKFERHPSVYYDLYQTERKLLLSSANGIEPLFAGSTDEQN